MAFSDVKECIQALKDVQQTEHDNRELAREADIFLNKINGQWEPAVLEKFRNRPRYTFDECNPIVDDIMGDIEANEFGLHVKPTGGGATKQTANILEGIVRHIEKLSLARQKVYIPAARAMVSTGFGAIRIYTDYRNDDSFQQDLLLSNIPGAIDTVWFDPDSFEQDASDADFCWNLVALTEDRYKKLYPEGSGSSITTDITSSSWLYKQKGQIIIGELFYKKKFTRELALLSDGRIVVLDEEFNKIKDELASQGITILKVRTRPYYRVFIRRFDANDWLTDPIETVFSYIPIVPVYGNFRVSQNKIIYFGAIEKIKDAQRIINYSESRKIEEGALAPKSKIWMTKDQAMSSDVKERLAALNTSVDPVQFYDFVEGQPPPFYLTSPGPDTNLIETAQSAQQYIQRTSGIFDEGRGTAPPRRSGYAIERLQEASNSPKRKWFTALEIALTHVCRILVDSIPRVYDTPQVIRVINQDRSEDYIKLYDYVKDEQTGTLIKVNDISIGQYEVACSAGPAFESKQQQTVNTIKELSEIDPSIIQLGGDILLQNIDSPGIDKLAARKRRLMLMQGLIPEDQQTQEERQLVTQMQASNSMSPVDQANLIIAQAQAQEVQGRNEERAMKLTLEQQKLQLKEMELQLKAQMAKEQNLVSKLEALSKQISEQASALKTLREALGIDTIITKDGLDAFKEQASKLQGLINQ